MRINKVVPGHSARNQIPFPEAVVLDKVIALELRRDDLFVEENLIVGVEPWHMSPQHAMLGVDELGIEEIGEAAKPLEGHWAEAFKARIRADELIGIAEKHLVLARAKGDHLAVAPLCLRELPHGWRNSG